MHKMVEQCTVYVNPPTPPPFDSPGNTSEINFVFSCFLNDYFEICDTTEIKTNS